MSAGIHARPRRRGVAVPAVFTLALLAVLIGLGNWQLDRKVWKENFIDTLDRRLHAEPVVLPQSSSWPQLTPDQDEFRRVRFSAALEPQAAALVYAGGAAFRPDVSGPGYWVLAPARLPDGSLVVIDRGFVPEGRQDAAESAPAEGEMVGVLRWPERPGWFTPAPDRGRDLWFVRDPVAIAAAKNWGEVAPFYVELETPQPPGGLPQAGALEVNLPDNHLQYAITWFGLAAALVGVFGFWTLGRWRETRQSEA